MRLRRVALVPASLSLLAVPAAALAAPGMPGFTVPPAPSSFARNVTVAPGAEFFKGAAALDAAGNYHLAWDSTENTITSCTLPRSAHACSATATLRPEQSPTNLLGPPQVIVNSPNNIEVLATECCTYGPQGPQTTHWTSADNGATFDGPQETLNLGSLDMAVIDRGQLVAVGTKPDGTIMEQVKNTTGFSNTPFVVGKTNDPVTGAQVGYDASGGVLIASYSTTTAGQPGVTTVTYQPDTGSGPFGQPTAIATGNLSGEMFDTLASGAGQTWLLTRQDNPSVLQNPVLLRQWNGSSFGAPVTVPLPGQGGDTNLHLAIDGAGRLHVFFTGKREGYRLWHEVSADGGKTWTSSLLDANFTAPGIYPVLDAAGIGIALEIPAAPGPVIVQPLLITPKLTLKASLKKVKGKLMLVLTGKSSPDSHVPVILQQVNGTKFPKVASLKMDKSGNYTVTMKLPRAGNRQYRVTTTGVAGSYDIAASPNASIKIPKH